MKKAYFFLPFLLLLTLPAWAGGKNPKPDTVAGHYSYGHEVTVFKPCGGSKIYWVEGKPRVMDKLRKKHLKNILIPYGDMPVVLKGVFGPKAEEGFAEQYDGVFTVKKIKKIRKENTPICVEKK